MGEISIDSGPIEWIGSKKFAPCVRTILYSKWDQSSEYYRFSFPELTLLLDSKGSGYATIEARDGCYPFIFFNVLTNGAICLRGRSENLNDLADLFWLSAFTGTSVSNFHSMFPVNRGIGLISLKKWMDITAADPGFMGREFDPEFYVDSAMQLRFNFPRVCSLVEFSR